MDYKDYQTIKSTKLFDGLSRELVAQVIGNKSAYTFKKGQLLFQQGDEAKSFYVILKGWVKLFRQQPSGDQAILHMFTVGETFAEVAMFGSHEYPASAEVVTDARLLAIDSEHFKKQVLRNPEIAMRMLASTSGHLRHLVSEIEQMKSRTSIQRLAYFLLEYCPKGTKSAVLELPYEKNLIATRLGITPESLSRVLYQLRDHGVHCEKNKIVISDITSLQRIVMS